jgi:hypothetical protein
MGYDDLMDRSTEVSSAILERAERAIVNNTIF